MPVATQDLAISFTTLGGLMILGLAAQWLGQKSSIPRVTLLIGLGILAGPSGADLVSGECPDRQPESSNAYIKKRFTGQLKRSLSLPEDIDPESATARYTNGVLQSALSAGLRRRRVKSRSTEYPRCDMSAEKNMATQSNRASEAAREQVRVMRPAVDVFENGESIS